MDEELAKYIVDHYDMLLTAREKLGLKHLRHQFIIEQSSEKNDINRKIHLYKKSGWISTEMEILELVKGGQDALNRMIAERIMREHPGEVFINNCPKCGRLARTPLAKQCRHCSHSWR